MEGARDVGGEVGREGVSSAVSFLFTSAKMAYYNDRVRFAELFSGASSARCSKAARSIHSGLTMACVGVWPTSCRPRWKLMLLR